MGGWQKTVFQAVVSAALTHRLICFQQRSDTVQTLTPYSSKAESSLLIFYHTEMKNSMSDRLRNVCQGSKPRCDFNMFPFPLLDSVVCQTMLELTKQAKRREDNSDFTYSHTEYSLQLT